MAPAAGTTPRHRAKARLSSVPLVLCENARGVLVFNVVSSIFTKRSSAPCVRRKGEEVEVEEEEKSVRPWSAGVISRADLRWPMAPSLGREWHVPGPATQDGITTQLRDAKRSEDSLKLVNDMCAGLSNFASGGVQAMNLETYWHPLCNWYGPSGIGTGRGLAGFRNWHQIPFLNALPNRGVIDNTRHMFSDGNYVGFTAWPGMQMTISGDGWLGIAPANQEITMRSLDFWRCEDGLIRENWVLIDLLDVYNQLGVDVLGRMQEFNKAKRIL